jgi:hypothetical protein
MSLIALVLAGCGGGGGGGTTTTASGGVYILGTVILSASTYIPAIRVNNGSVNGTPIVDAAVTVNGQAVTYNPLTKEYDGYGSAAVTVVPDASGKFNLSVTSGGSTYTASVTALTSVPVITMPVAFIAASANTISWTQPGGMTGTMIYTPYIPNSGGATPVYGPTSIFAMNAVIPANTTVAGRSYTLVLTAAQMGTLIANAASGSNFGVTANSSQISFTAQ